MNILQLQSIFILFLIVWIIIIKIRLFKLERENGVGK